MTIFTLVLHNYDFYGSQNRFLKMFDNTSKFVLKKNQYFEWNDNFFFSH